jgi:hypothetical protein
MSENDIQQEARAFFEAYRATFQRLEAAPVADFFAFPLQVVGDGREVSLSAVPSRDAWLGDLERLLGMYRLLGVSTARALELTVQELSPRLCQASLHWELYDGQGKRLYDFNAIYTLARQGENLRIAAIAHNESPRLRACLAQVRTAGG